MNIPVLTFDGPSGAGKGTVSRAVAKQLGWNYLDSGSIYRSLAIASLKQGINIEDVNVVVKVAEALSLEFECGDELIVKLDGKDITAELPFEETGNTASIIAAYPEVRTVLLQKQKDFRQQPGLVADGRDMGTTVFPDAAVKIFLTASAEERADRRYKQLINKGESVSLAALLEDIKARDERDSSRSASPLVPAEDAILLDSTSMSIEEVLSFVSNAVEKKGI